MEVLAGARDEAHHRALQRLLLRAYMLPTSPGADFSLAANIYRTCRYAGRTPRSLMDCLVAAVAIRSDVPVLHADRDFEMLAAHSALQLAL
jgi:predicted nucleic acid-binding protein